jgi:surface antigen
MDKSDKRQLNDVFEKYPSGQTVTWVNSNSGNDFRVTPRPAFTNPSTNRICRKAEIYANIDDGPQKTMLTACRNARGQWVVSF